jgi:hypothetical protein
MRDEDKLLSSMNPDEVAEACRMVAPEAIAEVDRVLEPALEGVSEAVIAYVSAFQDLVAATSRVLARTGSLVSSFAPDVVADQAAAAPFDVWAAEYGAGLGVALYAVEQLRPGGIHHAVDLRGGRRLAIKVVPKTLRSRDMYLRFRDEVERLRRHKVSEASGGAELLERVARRFQLSHTELGKLFGVSRQAAKKWLDGGQVPAERQAKVATVFAIAELVAKHLEISALPGIARTPADDYGGLTLLEMIAADRHGEVLAGARDAFDYSSAA